jgi:hypothetical protein
VRCNQHLHEHIFSYRFRSTHVDWTLHGNCRPTDGLYSLILLFDHFSLSIKITLSYASCSCGRRNAPFQAWHLYELFFLRYVLIGQASERAFGKRRRRPFWMSRPLSRMYIGLPKYFVLLCFHNFLFCSCVLRRWIGNFIPCFYV